jgi:hypothetical protein
VVHCPYTGRDRIVAALGAALVAALTAYVAVVDPNHPGRYPPCPVHALTGLYCPGCGALRAIHALTRGDLLTALHRNAALTLFLPVAVAAWLRLMTGHQKLSPRATHWATLSSLVVILAWTVVRNLPFPPFTVLAP